MSERSWLTDADAARYELDRQIALQATEVRSLQKRYFAGERAVLGDSKRAERVLDVLIARREGAATQATLLIP